MESSAAVGMEHSPDHAHDMSRSEARRTTTESLSFHNHSSATLPNNLPPSVDDRPLARQKRRRTSPGDQAILEAAYTRDCKPDKAARLELVKQVALGEKEVQIWFQNRRQTSRRKSRPLLPHEIAQYHLARSSVSSYQLPSFEFSSEPTSDDGPITDTVSSSPDPSQSHSTEDSVISSSGASHAVSVGDSTAPPIDTRAPVGYLANRRSAPSLRPDAPSEHDTLPWSRPVQTMQQRSSSSLVRLSLTGDGNAQVVTKDGSSPSPPRPQQTSTDHFDKTKAPEAAAREPISSYSQPERRPLHRSTSVRSRDSRTWQFWCDKEARNELESKAEKDASGSAADAIDLLRSTSGRRVLGALSTRRTNVLSRHTSFLQRKRLDSKPPMLQKSSTSLGRLQSSSKVSGNPATYPRAMHKAGGDVQIPGNDSDKENWSPRSHEQSESSADDRSTLDDSLHSHKEYAHSHHGPKQPYPINRKSVSIGNSERTGPDTDAELAAFMRGGGNKGNSFSEAADMDCIQGLLSLSQGNWR